MPYLLRYVAVVLLFPGIAVSASILNAGVGQEEDRYTMSVTARINAPLEVVYDAITDFNNLSAINPSVETSRVLDKPAPQTWRVRTVINVCILVFCKQVEQVQDMVLPEEDVITAVILPDASDFRSGQARWDFKSRDGVTVMYFAGSFEPDFWVPPLIGPWLIKRHLMHETETMAMHIETRVDEQQHH